MKRLLVLAFAVALAYACAPKDKGTTATTEPSTTTTTSTTTVEQPPETTPSPVESSTTVEPPPPGTGTPEPPPPPVAVPPVDTGEPPVALRDCKGIPPVKTTSPFTGTSICTDCNGEPVKCPATATPAPDTTLSTACISARISLWPPPVYMPGTKIPYRVTRLSYSPIPKPRVFDGRLLSNYITMLYPRSIGRGTGDNGGWFWPPACAGYVVPSATGAKINGYNGANVYEEGSNTADGHWKNGWHVIGNAATTKTAKVLALDDPLVYSTTNVYLATHPIKGCYKLPCPK